MSQAALRYLATAEPGLRWMRTYHRRNLQLDAIRAVEALRRAETMVQTYPDAGRRYEDSEAVRELKITSTAFSLFYTVARGTVRVIDVRDEHGLRSAEALRAFAAELRAKSGE